MTHSINYKVVLLGSKQARPILQRLRKEFGDKCQWCGNIEKLQFAHIKPTKIRGSARGMDARARDIQKNKTHYMLLCHWCHKIHNKLYPHSTTPKIVLAL